MGQLKTKSEKNEKSHELTTMVYATNRWHCCMTSIHISKVYNISIHNEGKKSSPSHRFNIKSEMFVDSEPKRRLMTKNIAKKTLRLVLIEKLTIDTTISEIEKEFSLVNQSDKALMNIYTRNPILFIYNASTPVIRKSQSIEMDIHSYLTRVMLIKETLLSTYDFFSPLIMKNYIDLLQKETYNNLYFFVKNSAFLRLIHNQIPHQDYNELNFDSVSIILVDILSKMVETSNSILIKNNG
jgi:hypothetical protein